MYIFTYIDPIQIHHSWIGKYTTGWWFQTFFLCSPLLFGEDEPNLTFAYLSDGLVKNHQPDNQTIIPWESVMGVLKFPSSLARPAHSMGRQIRLELWHLAAEELLVKSGKLRGWKIQRIRMFGGFLCGFPYILGEFFNIIWELGAIFFTLERICVCFSPWADDFLWELGAGNFFLERIYCFIFLYEIL